MKSFNLLFKKGKIPRVTQIQGNCAKLNMLTSERFALLRVYEWGL